jgi:hypothetical protein
LFLSEVSSSDAFLSSSSVGGLFGSNCAINFFTVGVYGAAGSSLGDLLGGGSSTGSEYGATWPFAAETFGDVSMSFGIRFRWACENPVRLGVFPVGCCPDAGTDAKSVARQT